MLAQSTTDELQNVVATPVALEIYPTIQATAKVSIASLTADEQRYLLGPIVYHPGGWDAGEILPRLIPQARIELVLSGEKEMATLEEALAYLSSASLTAPMHSEYTDVALWLFQTVWEKHDLVKGESAWKALGYDKPLTLTPYLKHEVLYFLRRDIRRAVIRNSKFRPVLRKTEESHASE